MTDQDHHRIVPVADPGPSVPLFGVDAAAIGRYRLLLDTAREQEPLPLGASTFIWAFDASAVGATVDLQFNRTSNSKIPFKHGLAMNARFSEVFVSHTAQSGVWIEFLYIREGQDPRSFAFANAISLTPAVTISGTPDVRVDIGDTLSSLADLSIAAAATTLVHGAEPTRRTARITNPASNPREFRVGDSGADATEGTELNPGESIEITSTAIIYAFNPHVAAMTIQRTKVLD